MKRQPRRTTLANSLIGGAFTLREIHVVWPKRLSTLLLELDVDGVGIDVDQTVEVATDHFPVA